MHFAILLLLPESGRVWSQERSISIVAIGILAYGSLIDDLR